MFQRGETWQRYSFVVKVVVKIMDLTTIANRRFFINPAKETIAKCFYYVIQLSIIEIDKYALLLLFVLVFFLSNHVCAQGFILAGIVNDAVQLAVSN